MSETEVKTNPQGDPITSLEPEQKTATDLLRGDPLPRASPETWTCLRVGFASESQ